MVLPSDDCDECKPGGKAPTAAAVAFSSLPFIVTFLLVSIIVLQKLFPALSGDSSHTYRRTPFSTFSNPARWTTARLSALACSTTIALAAVLAELILCEISNSINPEARRLAFRLTVPLLLFLLVIAIPFLEIHSLIAAAGWDHTGNGKGKPRLAWILQLICFSLWLMGFWWSGEKLLGKPVQTRDHTAHAQTLSESSLERLGVLGISFMALLSGFASVSNPWQTLGSQPRPVTEGDIARKAGGLEATNEMLTTKQSRLRAVERRISDAVPEGFFQKAIGSIRGSADHAERKSLELEISGLETMAISLSTSLETLRSRYTQQQRSKTPTGRLLLAFSYGFSLFCIYRILTTSLTAIRHIFASTSQDTATAAAAKASNNQQPPSFSQPSTSTSTSTSDPITTILTILARHYDPTLNPEAYTRQLTFLFSFIILLASFSS
ncbi:MAG: hypothetical protein Q9190_004359, partial [Brigantiaea leucoxantha]